MSEEKCCADCFYCGDRVGDYRSVSRICNKTGKVHEIDYLCSHFLDQNSPNARGCWECDYFGTYKSGSIFEKENYCEKKGKVVDPDSLACSYFRD